MVIDLVVPEEGLVPISPEEVLRSDVLVWIFDSLLQWGEMAPVLPMLVPQIPCIDAAENEAWDDNVEGQSAPEITSSCSMSFHSRSFPIEGIVLWSDKLLSGLWQLLSCTLETTLNC